MRRRILAVLLTAGMFWGFASGFASLHAGHAGAGSPCRHAPPPETPAEPGR